MSRTAAGVLPLGMRTTNTWMIPKSRAFLPSICNYDPDILPYLNAPYGTAYFRNDDGAFEIDEEWNPDGDDYESDEPSDDGL